MGVDTRICLPHTARLDDVVKVLGILAGRRKSWVNSSGARWVEVEGAKAHSYDNGTLLTSCAEVVINGPLPDGAPGLRCMFHFDFGIGQQTDYGNEYKGRGLMPRSTPQWVAAGRRLVEFFGGWMDYRDDDDVDVDHVQPIRSDLTACNGDAWDEFQQRIWAVEPLTVADITAMHEHACYVLRGASS